MIHINDTEEVIANSTVINGEDPLPASNYDSPEESMYPLLETVQWENHGIYLLGSQGEKVIDVFMSYIPHNKIENPYIYF